MWTEPHMVCAKNIAIVIALLNPCKVRSSFNVATSYIVMMEIRIFVFILQEMDIKLPRLDID